MKKINEHSTNLLINNTEKSLQDILIDKNECL